VDFLVLFVTECAATHFKENPMCRSGKMKRSRIMAPLACAAILCALALPSVGSAELQLGVGGGVFSPWEGDLGYTIGGSLLYQFENDRPWRVGAEISYRKSSSEFFGVSDVNVWSIRVQAQGHYVFRPGKLTPYLGLGIGFSVNTLDEDKLEDAGWSVDQGTGAGFAVDGIVGVEAPLGWRLSIFGEGRFGADIQLTDSDDLDAENIGGISGVAGLRIRF